jgi:hypothetical protein
LDVAVEAFQVRSDDDPAPVLRVSCPGHITGAFQAVRDKVIVITGASSGLGLQTARQLAGQSGEIVMIVRDRASGENAQSKVAEAATGKSPVLLTADLSV